MREARQGGRTLDESILGDTQTRRSRRAGGGLQAHGAEGAGDRAFHGSALELGQGLVAQCCGGAGLSPSSRLRFTTRTSAQGGKGAKCALSLKRGAGAAESQAPVSSHLKGGRRRGLLGCATRWGWWHDNPPLPEGGATAGRPVPT